MFAKALLSTLLLLPLVITACAGTTTTPSTSSSAADSSQSKPDLAVADAQPTGTPLVGTDGKGEILLPEGWSEDQTLHDDAEIQAANAPEEMYVLVLSESKADFQGIDLAKHSEITRGILTQNLTNPQVSEPTDVTSVGGNPAVQYKIDGAVGNINVTYLHTTVETANNFHQILAWTLPSSFDSNQAELQQVIQSFQEVQP